MVALAHGGGSHALQVAPGPRFGHRDGGDQLAAREPGQPAGLLLVVRQVDEVRGHDVVVEGEAEAGRADPDDLFDDHRVVAEVLDPRPAEILRHPEAEHPDLAGLLPHLTGDDAVLLPPVVVRHDLPGQELAHGLPEEIVLLLEEVSLHGLPPLGSPQTRIRFCFLEVQVAGGAGFPCLERSRDHNCATVPWESPRTPCGVLPHTSTIRTGCDEMTISVSRFYERSDQWRGGQQVSVRQSRFRCWVC